MTAAGEPARAGVEEIAAMKRRGQPIVMVTAYDHPGARVLVRAGVDIILVGDSAAMTVLGYTSTREVSLDEMLMLTRAVVRGAGTSLVVGDMPFGTYEGSDKLAVETARAFVAAGCGAVKLEGAGVMLDRVRAIVAAGIRVMGHVGLTPQGVLSAEGYRARGRTADEAMGIVRDALALEQAGCFSLVVEAVASPVADALMSVVAIPVIGIGAGPAPDGQVLVFHDILGLGEGRVARFVERYAEGATIMTDAIGRFAADVREHRYPATQHTYAMAADELSRFRALFGESALQPAIREG